MANHKKNKLWIFLGIVIVLGLFWQFVPLSNAQERLDKLPIVGTQFGGKNIAITDYEKSFFYRVNLLKRLYNIQGQFFFITVLDGTDNRHIVHDPYYCFRGDGWDIVSEKKMTIPGGSGSLVAIRKGDIEKEALFWFADEGENFSSPFKYWIATTLRRLTFGLSGNEPVLVLVQPINTTQPDWSVLDQQFPSLFKL